MNYSGIFNTESKKQMIHVTEIISIFQDLILFSAPKKRRKERTIVSVTEVLSPFYRLEHFSRKSLDLAQRDKKYLKICIGIAKNLWIPVEEQYRGYISSFKFWFSSQAKKVLLGGERLEDEDLKIIGTPDLLVLNHSNEIILVSLKTLTTIHQSYSTHLSICKQLFRKSFLKSPRDMCWNWHKFVKATQKSYLVQVSIYKHLLEKHKKVQISKSGVLILNKEGKIPEFICFSNAQLKEGLLMFFRFKELYEFFQK